MAADISKRLAAAEAKHVKAAAGDLRSRILTARRAPPKPQHSRAELLVLADDNGLVGRIARGMLRIGFVADKSCGRALDPDLVLPQMAGYLFADPLSFTMFAFDWGRDSSLRVVKLQPPWSDAYDTEHGVEAWAAEFMAGIGAEVRKNAFDGSTPVPPVRRAVTSGHGVSKSASTAMLVNWIMTTRPNARGVVTANTAPQLSSKTWAEIAKWLKRSVFSSWFSISTGAASMRMTQVDAPEAWNCVGQTAAEERVESFAGLHAADSSPFYVFDEASAIPASIWEVAEGGLTDGEPFIFAFGNPTRTSTKFHECFTAQRRRWVTTQVDSRTCQLTNKALLQQWIDDYGLASDFVKVRVLGEFPSASTLQFISRDLAEDAAARPTPSSRGEIVVVGVDPARFGDDESVIYTRAGRDARTVPPIKLRKVDTMTLASRVAEHVNFLRGAGQLVTLNVDGGGVGGGVVDRLRSIGYTVNEVGFGTRALDPRKWANRRAEIWGAMREWLKVGAIPNDRELIDDLTGVEYGYTATDALLLERKESMKARGLSSPDAADALAITFAVPVPIPEAADLGEGRHEERERQRVLADRKSVV